MPIGKSSGIRLICLLRTLLMMTCPFNGTVHAQAASQSHIGIIVTSTAPEAQHVLNQLQAGMDFSVLAKEVSIDATANDGGYMGLLDPSQLRSELRDALKNRKAGQLSDIVQIASGFVVLKVLANAPVTSDLNPKRVSSLIRSSAIRYGASVSGLMEANLALQDYPKPEEWNRNLQTVCKLRGESLASAQEYLKQKLAPASTDGTGLNRMQGHSVLAQLYGFQGQMKNAIEEWKLAYDEAQLQDSKFLPNLEESLGVSYLHLSEMENGAYHDSLSLDIFPPLQPSASYKYKDESRQAIEHFESYLRDRPNDLEVKWLLNLAYMTLGEYPMGVPQAYRIPESDFHSKNLLK